MIGEIVIKVSNKIVIMLGRFFDRIIHTKKYFKDLCWPIEKCKIYDALKIIQLIPYCVVSAFFNKMQVCTSNLAQNYKLRIAICIFFFFRKNIVFFSSTLLTLA